MFLRGLALLTLACVCGSPVFQTPALIDGGRLPGTSGTEEIQKSSHPGVGETSQWVTRGQRGAF